MDNVHDRSLSFKNQNFFIGIDTHQKQWTFNIVSMNMVLKKRLSIDPYPSALLNYMQRHYPDGNYHAVYEAFRVFVKMYYSIWNIKKNIRGPLQAITWRGLKPIQLWPALVLVERVQRKHDLSHIYVVSDVEGSYRAWCFSKVDFKTLLAILVDSLDILDYSFFYYTVKRKKATLRTNNKKGRPPQKVVSVLESYFAPFPAKIEIVKFKIIVSEEKIN